MIVSHGGVSEIRHPDLAHAKTRLDFGKAFYLTTFRAQAEKWARRKASRARKAPIVNKYELLEDFTGFKVKDFGTTNAAWLDFVCACRGGKTVWRQYDIIKGRVANDDVFKTIDSYLKGDITKTAAIRELRYAKPNDQIAINKASALKMLLTFKEAYKVTMK